MMRPSERDGFACVHDGKRLDTGRAQASEHHRRHGDRGDNRTSAKILLCGTGITDCHGWAGGNGRAEAVRLGLVISRHTPRMITLFTPVYYGQPDLARVGWYLLDDDAGMWGPLDAVAAENAEWLARAVQAICGLPGTTLAQRQAGARLLADVPDKVVLALHEEIVAEEKRNGRA